MADFERQITSALEESQEDIVSFIQTLIQSPSLANDEGPVQEVIQGKLETLGLDTEKIIVKFDKLKDHPAFCDDGFSPDSRVNIVGQWHNGGGRSLILNGHVDVVPTGPENLWNKSPWSGYIKNGRIYGRGSCDMKAG